MRARSVSLTMVLILAGVLGLCGCDSFAPGLEAVLGVWYVDLMFTEGEWQSPEDRAQPNAPMTTYFMLIMRENGTFETRIGLLDGPEWVNAVGTWSAEGSRYILALDGDRQDTVTVWLADGWLFANEGRLSYRFSREPIYWPTLHAPGVPLPLGALMSVQQ